MKKNGFTIIELTIMIVIISILASLGTVQLLRTQLVARDKERVDDINTIAAFFENTYQNGQPDGVVIPSGDPTVTTATPMGYPSTAITSTSSQTEIQAQTQAILGAIDQRALKSPLKKTLSIAAVASNDNVDRTGTAVTPSSTTDQYVYQPLKSDGTVCTVANPSNGLSPNPQTVIAPRLDDVCVKFRIFYISEAKKIWQVKNSTFSDQNGL